MIIGRDYILKKPTGPSKPKLFLDIQVVPRVVNLAGGLEVALDRASVRWGVRPSVILAFLAVLLSLGAVSFLRGQRSAGRKTAKGFLPRQWSALRRAV